MQLREFVKLVHPQNPYDGFDISGQPLDRQGWGHESPIFAQIIQQLRPRNIIEVGTWKGASAIGMAELCRDAGITDATILCVDTWIGSHPTLWMGHRDDLQIKFGFPRMYDQFLANVIRTGHSDTIFPLPMTSLMAAKWLTDSGVLADAVYLDTSHEYDETYLEVFRYYKTVRSGGVIFGDDYTKVWPGVVAAVNRFAGENNLTVQTLGEKWLIVKP